MMLRPLHALLLGTVCVVVCSAAGMAGPPRTKSFVVTEARADGWTIAYSPRPAPTSVVSIDGRPHILFNGESDETDVPVGSPLLPVEVLSLGVPPADTVSAEIIGPVYETITGQEVAPRPTYQLTEEREAVLSYVKNQGAYSRNQFLPVRQVVPGPTFDFRRQRIATVRVSPLQYNAATRTLRRLTSAKIVVRLSRAHAAVPAGMATDPHVEQMYAGLLENYEQARGWRRLALPGTPVQDDSARSWFEAGRTYYRIPVAADGWYKITPADLAAAGTSFGSIDTSSLRLFWKARAVPFSVRPDSNICFYGRMNHGDSTYFDFFTDTSAYWLTWGGTGKGSAIGIKPPAQGTPSTILSSSTATVHLEENTDYYEGTGQVEITDNGPVPGEGWVWEYYYPGSVYAHAAMLDAVDTTGDTRSTLRVRIVGTTLHYNSPDHIARFWMNDSLLGEVGFEGRGDTTALFAFPTQWLREGGNQIRIASIATPSNPNQFYLDWFEIGYRRHHRAVRDQLLINAPADPGSGVVSIRAEGFGNAAIDIIDLTSAMQITGAVTSGDSSTGYTVTFTDSLRTGRTYVIVARGGELPSLPLGGKQFRDIRANPAGADYIVIAHRDFLAAAQRLADHRRTVNGVRATVVDVQDIYDEFNFGITHTNPIKGFLRYAYENWHSPAPVAVAMVGDASWDPHRYMSTTIKTDFVPAYGVPAGDNWFVCFDSMYTFLPAMFIGRIPVQDPTQAARTIDKLIMYDGQAPAEWNKNFMFISGGTNPSEQASFKGMNDAMVQAYVEPAPVGGTAFNIYKTTPDAIDGENKQLMRDLVKMGLSFINFLGHSGGRIWGVDIGNPNDLENTGGQLPFVSSVSCNVGGFAEPSNNVLSEDFVLADNRGASAMWASSSLGYANVGATLVNLFLDGVTSDSLREYGMLTTMARIRLWQARGSDFVTLASVNLNPLIGDPLSGFALAMKPELALQPGDLATNAATAGSADTSLLARLTVHNFGLVPSDSVEISLTDTYGGHSAPVVAGKKLAPTHHRDSLSAPWKANTQLGMHTLTATLDPAGKIPEVSKSNNTASLDEYVYANDVAVIRPLDNLVVGSGTHTLIVSGLQRGDTAGIHYEFQLDTVVTFDSPFLLSSAAIAPGLVDARWATPALPPSTVFFWRARRVEGSIVSRWKTSSFSTAADVAVAPFVRWRQSSPRQFGRDQLAQSSPTDTGVTIAPQLPVRILARSVGYRANLDKDYYSIISVNEQTMIGYWWVNGNSFMVARVNELTGERDFQAFNVAAQAAKADEMASYLNAAPSGNYLTITVIFDGYTNVNDNLRQALKSLGASYVDSLRPGHSWMLIARKGAPLSSFVPKEQWSPDGIAIDSLDVENYYSFVSGNVSAADIPVPVSLGDLRWQPVVSPGKTSVQLSLAKIRADRGMDTLVTIGHDSTAVSLSYLSQQVAHDSGAVSMCLSALLSTTDGLLTPLLRSWSFDFVPPPDGAISNRTVGIPGLTVTRGIPVDLPVTVWNPGYRILDSALVRVSWYDPSNMLRPLGSVRVDSIPVDGSRTVIVSVPTANFAGQIRLHFNVGILAMRDLYGGNNDADYSFTVLKNTGITLQMFADGTQLMDGDFVAARAKILVRVPDLSGNPSQQRTELLVDNQKVGSIPGGGPAGALAKGASPAGDALFDVQIPDGVHALKALFIQESLAGPVDTAAREYQVNVKTELTINRVFNYPNPFASETYFTMVLTGERAPDEGTIRIYTVAGRKIRQIAIPPGQLQIGFNKVYWDGRDNDGDEIANGTYFYQVEAKSGDKVQTVTEKMAKIR